MDHLDFFDRIEAARTPRQVCELLQRHAAELGLPYFAIGTSAAAGHEDLPAFFHTNWPGQYFEAYRELGMVRHDAVPKIASLTMRRVTWAELLEDRAPYRMTPGEKGVLAFAGEFGFRGGLVVPVHGPGGAEAVVSFSGPADPQTPRARATLHMPALYAVERLKALHAGARPAAPPVRLTAREGDALAWLIAGETDEGIAARMGVSERMPVSFRIPVAAAAMTLSLAATGAFAVPVPITNPGFQVPDVALNGFTDNVIDGWTVVSTGSLSAGVFEPGAAFFTGLPTGEQTAYIQGVGSSIWQTVGTVAADTDYTLSFDAGDRLDLRFSVSQARFFVGSFGGTSFDQAIAAPATDGTFLTQSITIGAASLAPFVGQDLLIAFTTQDSAQTQLNIDNVSLEAMSRVTVPSDVPLPAGLPLLATALLGFAAVARRRG